MTFKERLELAGRYLLARLQEPSTWKGIILIVSAAGWYDLDSSSKGEAFAQAGLLIVGLLNAGLPRRPCTESHDRPALCPARRSAG
jgi:hypothetical protein